ncbi:1,4-dihydroxy-6-naphthoate synthase [Sediminibacterium soli]|uniref:1,4-dihydroxy-6-naphthoate synthase n=1 Tax=Sediminibacterium soli TaxID=2698829 RepID=UPI00137A5768|nr:1,4-dihydroxy-6-naphthoate synthase [Sediminibacterium soli]NCI48004.1 1,4-dihydroxy-6-naphthoate synthase [Sediminibacterium soli]
MAGTTYTLGFSPCPNDTFIFDALVNGKIDTHGISFDVALEDVQTLNEWAINGKLDISKISYGVLPLVAEKYQVLQSGGALGKGVGPLLIAKDAGIRVEDIDTLRIAIPGVNTTAHILFSLAFPEAKQKQFLVFHQVEDAVLSGRADAGVIIHENRFTYQDKGLHRLMDLGEYWEKHTHAPIPLGGIVVHNRIDRARAAEIDALIKKSVEYAFAEYPHLSEYVQQHAQEMNPKVMRQHIDLYVNDYSLWLGEDGKKAVRQLCEVHHRLYPQQPCTSPDIFLSPE